MEICNKFCDFMIKIDCLEELENVLEEVLSNMVSFDLIVKELKLEEFEKWVLKY